MTDEQAHAIAEAWRAAWNSHDPERVIAHYASDVTYFSPFIEPAGTRPAGELSGRDALREYAVSAFDRFPELHFDTPLQVGAGSSSVCVVYRSVRDLLALETLVVGGDGLIGTALCHYTRWPESEAAPC